MWGVPPSWSDQSQFIAHFMVFNLWIGPGFLFLSLWLFFNFPLTTLELDLFSGAYLNKFTVSVVPSDGD